MAEEKKKKRSHPVDPPAPKPNEQVPAGDDSDINEGRDPDVQKDVDRVDERGESR